MTKIQDVHNIRNTLYEIHKFLIDYQANETSVRLGRSLNPYELWQMAMEDEDFEWLKIISSSVVTMDEEIDQAKHLTDLDIDYMAIYLRSLFFFPLAQHMDFHERIRSIKETNPELLHLLKDLYRKIELILEPRSDVAAP